MGVGGALTPCCAPMATAAAAPAMAPPSPFHARDPSATSHCRTSSSSRLSFSSAVSRTKGWSRSCGHPSRFFGSLFRRPCRARPGGSSERSL